LPPVIIAVDFGGYEGITSGIKAYLSCLEDFLSYLITPIKEVFELNTWYLRDNSRISLFVISSSISNDSNSKIFSFAASLNNVSPFGSLLKS